jgi:glycine/D-amino acid oxidase-like deaminating enzyme
VSWLLERLLDEYDAETFNLQTNTAVERLQRYDASSWTIYTPRGQVRARQVLFATNAYTSYLLPKLAELVVPVRGQVCALRSPPGAEQLRHTHVWIEGADHQYLIHRGPVDEQVGRNGEMLHSVDRSLILGGQKNVVADWQEGISRDDVVDPTISDALHRCLHRAVKLLPGDTPDPETLHADYEWTGIMGYSSDSCPWVGQMPSSLVDPAISDGVVTGLWISAGYTGHGMPVAPGCGAAVARMMLGKEISVPVPRHWMASDERVRTARGKKLPKTVQEIFGMPAEI